MMMYESAAELVELAGPLAKVADVDMSAPVIGYEREYPSEGQIASRLESFGRLGELCLERLETAGIKTRAKGLLKQRAEADELLEIDGALAAAYSLMFCDIVVQIEGGPNLVNWLYDVAMGVYELSDEDREQTRDKNALPLDREKECKLFPLKKHGAAMNRTNVWFTEVYQSMEKFDRNMLRDFVPMSGLMKGLTNDQATACLMYYHALRNSEAKNPELKAMLAVKYPERCKQASVAIKSLGLQWQRIGAVLVEGEVMQGRGAGEIDLVDIMKFRCSTKLKDTMLQVNIEQLAKEIDKIYEEEIDMDRYRYEPTDSFWCRRWGWGVNGSHNKVLEREEPKWKIDNTGLKRIHRRVYLEEVKDNPIDHWSGEVYVSCIEKLESGKTRPLQSIDSNTYACFEHMIAPVEGAWRGKRCILDPGDGGAVKMARRAYTMSGGDKDSAKLMIDYAAYDSQHTIEAATGG
jgi:hypothetical protein